MLIRKISFTELDEKSYENLFLNKIALFNLLNLKGNIKSLIRNHNLKTKKKLPVLI
jgi:hypothetical protein